MSFESYAHVEITEELLRHVWEGERDFNKGGHRFGLGREGKTEFPEHWDVSMVEYSIRSTLDKPQFIGIRFPIIRLRKQIGEVIVEVKLRIYQQALSVETAYPINGSGVFRNQSGLRSQLPLNIHSLEA